MNESVYVLTGFPDSKLFELAYAAGNAMKEITQKILDGIELSKEDLEKWDTMGNRYARICAVIEGRGMFESYKAWRDIQAALP